MFLIISSPVSADSSPGDNNEKWSNVEVVKSISYDTYEIYKYLFQQDNFELVGKLMTFFLEEQERGYQFERLSEGEYSVRSRSIQEGSTITIARIDRQGFVFTGELIIKKMITFNCRFRVETRFTKNEKDVEGKSTIHYDAPEIVKGVNLGYKLLTGQDLVAYKIADFLEGLYIVLNNLNSLDIKEWRELSQDQEFLKNLFFPINFSNKEIKMVEDILIKVGR